MLLSAGAVPAAPGDNALLAMQGENAKLTAQIEPAWRDALSRMSAVQLDELRHGASSDSIVLEGGETLAEFMATRQIIELPLEILVDPAAGATSRGGSFYLSAVELQSGGQSQTAA